MSYSVTEELPGVWFVDLRVSEGENAFIGAFIVASGGEAACVELGPASTAHKMACAVEELGIDTEQVKYLLPTHLHIDHAGAAGSLLKKYPQASVLAHPRAVPHMIDPDRALWQASVDVLGPLAELYGKPEPVPAERIMTFEEGMTLEVGRLKLNVHYTPGHASHHMSIMLEPGALLFPGDAAGCYLPGLDIIIPITPSPFRFEAELDSLEKLISLEPRTNAYTHFGFTKQPRHYMEAQREQLFSWKEIFKEIVAKDIINNNDIFSYLAERDENIKKLLEEAQMGSAFLKETALSFSGLIDTVKDEAGG
ncbi:MAG: MBL fold metallo-hydrolase [Thermodesulfobacteriota bacterium]